ncbi:MAG: HD domain-containing protein [Gemmatimonadaceae bacterium]
MRAYSDLINHAFAYAAIHHDGDTRKGTRVPYITHPANVALILARYDRDDETIVAAILHDVVEDCEYPGHTRATHSAQIEAKFGEIVLDTVLAVTHVSHDATGRQLTSREKKDYYLEHLGTASDRARWVSAADKLHNARAILSDLSRSDFPETFFDRFNVGREGTIRWYREVYERLRQVGFDGAIMGELAAAVEDIER